MSIASVQFAVKPQKISAHNVSPILPARSDYAAAQEDRGRGRGTGRRPISSIGYLGVTKSSGHKKDNGSDKRHVRSKGVTLFMLSRRKEPTDRPILLTTAHHLWLGGTRHMVPEHMQ